MLNFEHNKSINDITHGIKYVPCHDQGPDQTFLRASKKSFWQCIYVAK